MINVSCLIVASVLSLPAAHRLCLLRQETYQQYYRFQTKNLFVIIPARLCSVNEHHNVKASKLYVKIAFRQSGLSTFSDSQTVCSIIRRIFSGGTVCTRDTPWCVGKSHRDRLSDGRDSDAFYRICRNGCRSSRQGAIKGMASTYLSPPIYNVCGAFGTGSSYL